MNTGVLLPIHLGGFDGLYTAVYSILDAAKAERDVVRLYKGSHLSADPHDSVLSFGEFFARYRRGLLGHACAQARPGGRWTVHDLDVFDEDHRPRLPVRAVFAELEKTVRGPAESATDLLNRLTTRTHPLGAYRSGGTDEEARAVAALHFRGLGVPGDLADVVVSCGGAKGVFLAFCAALMCRRRFDELDHVGGVLLAPEGYYQSLRLIPAVFGGAIEVVPGLTGRSVGRWLTGTAGRRNRAVYVPLVNNADGGVLTSAAAGAVGAEVLAHNTINPGNPVFVVGDDVYAGSGADPGTPIGAVPGMSDWTVSVVSPSKTFALPTSRVAFATTTNPRLRAALCHYRAVFAHGRTPQSNELLAAAALAFTPVAWIDDWNRRYRQRFATVLDGLRRINAEAGFEAVWSRPPAGGWYLPLSVARTVFPVPISSGVDAFAVLLEHGLGLLPGELFGYRLAPGDRSVTLRATVAIDDRDLAVFLARLRTAVLGLRAAGGAAVADRALRRARQVADVDRILANTHY